MKDFLTAALVAGSLVSPIQAVALHDRNSGQAKVVSLDIQRTRVTNPLERDRLRRRAGTVQAALDNEQTLYFVNASVGTPAQSVRLHIDTGSSDMWLNTPSSTLCLQQSQPCQYAGVYMANSSSTYAYVGSWFNISYVDGSGASGDYATDAVSIGGNKPSKLQFGIGYKSTSAQGILGIGYTSNEVQVNRANKSPYNNLPAQMVADGMIQSNAYSLWLNDLDASTGSILFGGVDTAQYQGELQTLPIQQAYGGYSEFLITMTGLTLGSKAIANNQALAVLLDSGSSLTYLPESWVQQIYQMVGATYDPNAGAAYIPCTQKQNTTKFGFIFSSPTINVGMDELVLDLVTSSGKKPTFTDGTTACLFGIAPSGGSTNVLGDTFLRSAYVVYDLGNNEISLAQTNFNATANNVMEIKTGSSAVPDATKITNSVSATAGIIGGPVSTNGRNANAAGRSMPMSSVVAFIVFVGVASALV